MAIAVGVLLACCFAVWAVGIMATDRSLAELRKEASSSTDLHAALLSSELEKFRLVPFALATDYQVRNALAQPEPGNLRVLDQRFEDLAEAISAAAIYLVDRNGNTLAASNWNRTDSFVGENYGFRPYFRRAIATGHHEQFALGTVSRDPGLYIARRVEGRGSVGVIVLKLEFDALESEWRRSGEPAFVTNRQGVVLITARPEWRFSAVRKLSARQREDIRVAADFGDATLQSLPIRKSSWNGATVIEIAGERGDHFIESTRDTGTPGWKLHVLSPVTVRVAADIVAARLATVLALSVLIGISLYLLRKRQSAARRELEASNARDALEREVDERTRQVRTANRKLRSEIEDRIASEARLQDAREQLVQANKLASLGQITAGVAHEIAQPVAAIRSYADNGCEFLERGRIREAIDNFGQIGTMTERIGLITTELRGFSRRKVAVPGPVSLSDAIAGASLLLRDRIRTQGVEFVTADTDGLVVHGTVVRLEQVLVNVIGNALDALVDVDTPNIEIVCGVTEDRVVLNISNNGPAIPAEVAGSLFQPFTTAKEGGLGLGLVISREIMRDYGGDIALVSHEDNVTFQIDIRRS